MKLSDLAITEYEIVSGGALCPAVDVRLCRALQRDGTEKWAIREQGACLNRFGNWELEPQPSSRTDAFLRRCRFDSPQDALIVWTEKKCRSQFQHYYEMARVRARQ